jgi:hypothetical protein
MTHVPLVCCCFVLLCTLTLQAWVLECLGADEVVDYTSQDFADLYSAPDKQFDIVWDVLVGATAVAISDMHCMAWHACGKVAHSVLLAPPMHSQSHSVQLRVLCSNTIDLDCLS